MFDVCLLCVVGLYVFACLFVRALFGVVCSLLCSVINVGWFDRLFVFVGCCLFVLYMFVWLSSFLFECCVVLCFCLLLLFGLIVLFVCVVWGCFCFCVYLCSLLLFVFLLFSVSVGVVMVLPFCLLRLFLLCLMSVFVCCFGHVLLVCVFVCALLLSVLLCCVFACCCCLV